MAPDRQWFLLLKFNICVKSAGALKEPMAYSVIEDTRNVYFVSILKIMPFYLENWTEDSKPCGCLLSICIFYMYLFLYCPKTRKQLHREGIYQRFYHSCFHQRCTCNILHTCMHIDNWLYDMASRLEVK